jgi:hypothetical protein
MTTGDAMLSFEMAAAFRAIANQVERDRLDADRTIMLVRSVMDPVGKMLGQNPAAFVREMFGDNTWPPLARALMLRRAADAAEREGQRMTRAIGGVN